MKTVTANYENYDNVTETKKNVLRIANCRGKRAVMNDIKKARNILQNIKVELNESEGRKSIDKCTSLLWDVLQDNI